MLKLEIDKSKWICRKKISNAEVLHRRAPNTGQTHIGLFESSVPLGHISMPSLLIYSNSSYDTLTLLNPINSREGSDRSPKFRQGKDDDDTTYEGKTYESTYQKIQDIIKGEDETSSRNKNFYIIWGTLTNGRLFFILYNEDQSNQFGRYIPIDTLLSIRSKGIPSSKMHNILSLAAESVLSDYSSEYSVIESSEKIKTNNQTSRFFTTQESLLIQKIGKQGESLIDMYLKEKKQKREIQDYLWLSKIYPTADHDFEVTTNSGVVNMLEVKSTNSNFNTPFYWSRNERKLFLSNPSVYIIKRVFNVLEEEIVSFKTGQNMISLNKKLNIEGIKFDGTAIVDPRVVDINWEESRSLSKYYK